MHLARYKRRVTTATIVPRFAMPPRPARARQRLGEVLIERGLIRPADLANALTLQGQNGGLLGLNLVRLGAVSEARLLEVLSDQLGLGVLAPEDGPTPEQVGSFLAEIRSPLSWWAEREAVAWREAGIEGGGGRVLCAAVQPLDPLLCERLAQGLDTEDADSGGAGGQVVFLLAQRSLIEALTHDVGVDRRGNEGQS